MVDLLARWQKEIQKKIEGVLPERILAVIRRCPKCKQLGLSFDAVTNKIRCDRCGFEVTLRA